MAAISHRRGGIAVNADAIERGVAFLGQEFPKHFSRDLPSGRVRNGVEGGERYPVERKFRLGKVGGKRGKIEKMRGNGENLGKHVFPSIG